MRKRTRRGTGLSPHARGNRSRSLCHLDHVRSIPACAGKPGSILPVLLPNRVYPRMRGETDSIRTTWYIAKGLSPHARGNLMPTIRPGKMQGSIPACAGKPYPISRSRPRPGVYPRMRGETDQAVVMVLDVAGLSPHARGNLIEPVPVSTIAGSIPACAGKPPGYPPPLPFGWVYPRMRGETSVKKVEEALAQGLSPHARGNRSGVMYFLPRKGSIPACAGKPTGPGDRDTQTEVYPRMRGETGAWHYYIPADLGLSPHARGNHFLMAAPNLINGSIPACAGKPPHLRC